MTGPLASSLQLISLFSPPRWTLSATVTLLLSLGPVQAFSHLRAFPHPFPLSQRLLPRYSLTSFRSWLKGHLYRQYLHAPNMKLYPPLFSLLLFLHNPEFLFVYLHSFYSLLFSLIKIQVPQKQKCV